MEILKKEYTKYAKPMFFSIGRMAVYIFALLIILGAFSRIEESQFIFVNFFILCFLFLVAIIYDVINTIKVGRTYLTHTVQFTDDYVLFVDHRGTFYLQYETLTSYHLISDQIVLKVNSNRFIISGKHHGINYDELKEMVNYLTSKGVLNKVNRNFIYYVALFIALNFGVDYLFINVLNLSSDASLFGVLYIMYAILVGFIIWDKLSIKKLIVKEE